jgi:hypothetical protein
MNERVSSFIVPFPKYRNIVDINRVEGGGTQLFRTIFQVFSHHSQEYMKKMIVFTISKRV